MSGSSIVSVLCGIALASGGVAHAAICSRTAPSIGIDRSTLIPQDRDLESRTPASILRIEHIRLEAPPADAPKPSVLLKFDMLNESESSVTDISLEVVIWRKSVDELRREVIAGPFRILGHAIMGAGYTVNYRMLLRHLECDCDCAADVKVTSARIVGTPGT